MKNKTFWQGNNLENLCVNGCVYPQFLNPDWCCTAPWVDKNEIYNAADAE